MRSSQDSYQTPFDLVKAGVVSGTISFTMRFPFETFATRIRTSQKRIYEKSIHQSFLNFRDAISPQHEYQNARHLARSLFNIGFWLGFSYRISEGLITLPTQKIVKNYCLAAYDKSITNTILINAFAGYIASLIELLFLHPLDNLRIMAQSNPKNFQYHTVLSYYLRNQHALRKGSLLFVARNTLLIPICWATKSATEIALEQTHLSKTSQQFTAAFAFTAIMNLLGCPFDMMRATLLEAAQNPRPQNTIERMKHGAEVIRQLIRNNGMRILYRGAGMTTAASMSARIGQMVAFEYLSTKNIEESAYAKRN